MLRLQKKDAKDGWMDGIRMQNKRQQKGISECKDERMYNANK